MKLIVCVLVGVFLLQTACAQLLARITSKGDTARCVPGTNWFDGCNECFCSEQGFIGCTRKLCSEVAKVHLRCTPGTYWTEDCNDCFCTDNGEAGCTLKACHQEVFNVLPDKTFIV